MVPAQTSTLEAGPLTLILGRLNALQSNLILSGGLTLPFLILVLRNISRSQVVEPSGESAATSSRRLEVAQGHGARQFFVVSKLSVPSDLRVVEGLVPDYSFGLRRRLLAPRVTRCDAANCLELRSKRTRNRWLHSVVNDPKRRLPP